MLWKKDNGDGWRTAAPARRVVDMEDDEKGNDKRRHPRIAVSKSVRATKDVKEYEGEIKDISASGAALVVDAELDDEDLVALDIENMSQLSGRVARLFDDGFAVEFDMDDEEEDRLLAELTGLHNATQTEDS